jgi:type IV pilus assembly protein PilV
MHFPLKQPHMISRARGFSLVEVLVALLVISIGLLGIAKMQGLALANTNGGRIRALAAIEAESLRSTMQTERNYWANITGPLNITITGGASGAAITNGDTFQNATAITCASSVSQSTATSSMQTNATVYPCTGTGTVTCTSIASPCTAQKMAAYDLQQWAGRMQQVVGPTAGATIKCATATAAVPVQCSIIISWTEEQVNATSSETVNGMANPSYTLPNITP